MWSVRRRCLYLTTHNTHKRQTSKAPAGFEPAFRASERPQTRAVDRAATEIGFISLRSKYSPKYPNFAKSQEVFDFLQFIAWVNYVKPENPFNILTFKVWHRGLLYKLKLHFPDNLYLLLKSYLSERYFQVKIDYELTITPLQQECHKAASWDRFSTCYTGLFISPSGISELDCATTKTGTAERSISIGRESLQVFFFCTRGLGVLPGSTARV